MFDSIIPIGQTCNITFLLKNANLYDKTSLFEWFVSPRISDITGILQKIASNNDDDIISARNGYVYIGNIYSGHYTADEIRDIFIRRRDRLLETIRNSKRILFCRFDGDLIQYSTREIDEFIESVRAIHPFVEDVHILLITPDATLTHPAITTVFYDQHAQDPYCGAPYINELFVSSLNKLQSEH